MNINLLQLLGGLSTALFVLSCSKEEPETDYSWAENSESRIQEINTSSSSEITPAIPSSPVTSLTIPLSPATSPTIPSSVTTIEWQPSVDLFANGNVETFVDTSGELAVAYNATNTVAGGKDATVNGVTFVATGSAKTLTGNSGVSVKINSNLSRIDYGEGDFTNNEEITNLLTGGHNHTSNITIDNLTIGQNYLIQIFVHNKSRVNRFIVGFGDGSKSGVAGTAEINNSPLKKSIGEGTGDSIIGNFTAKTKSLTFNVFGTGRGPQGLFETANSASQINALQVRLIP